MLTACSHFGSNHKVDDNPNVNVNNTQSSGFFQKASLHPQANSHSSVSAESVRTSSSSAQHRQATRSVDKADIPASTSNFKAPDAQIKKAPAKETLNKDQPARQEHEPEATENGPASPPHPLFQPKVAKTDIEPKTTSPFNVTPRVRQKKLLEPLKDPIFNLNALLPSSKTTSDFSDYGFITPTEGLEVRVNDELRELRLDTPNSTPEKNLLDRLKKHFKLDLELDNKRIRNQLNWYVRNPNYLDRTFKRSARYLHYVVEEVKKRDLPMELALLPFVESAYDPFAYSHGRASGLWQFIPGTGKIYGLHQSWWYDGRRDVLASTKAALDYLSYLNKLFKGDWLHALAAYNSGSGRVRGAIKRNKKLSKKTDFWSLKLPKETKAYVPKLLAMAKVVLQPEVYGVTLPAIADKPYFKVVKTEAQIDLAQAASLADVDINEIYKLNPGFNQWASAPRGPHRLLVPEAKAANFKVKLKTLPPEKRLNWNRYSVKRGDSLIRIAKRFNTTPKLIKQINNLKSNLIREKQKLLIPIASKGKSYYDLSQHNRLKSKQSKLKGSQGSQKISYTVKAGDTMWDLSIAHKVGVRALAKWNGMAPRDPIKPGQKLLIWSKKAIQKAETTHTPIMQDRKMIKRIGYRVRKGDSLARIAGKFSVSIKDLITWNKLNRKKYLQPGQKLTIYVDLSNS